jgi:hypothetical protein
VTSSSASAQLSAHLWDLRAHAEAKLRCLTRLQQLVAKHDQLADKADRARKHKDIMADLADLVSISQALRAVSEEALRIARDLQ